MSDKEMDASIEEAVAMLKSYNEHEIAERLIQKYLTGKRMSILEEKKRDVLRKLNAAHLALQELYEMEEMLPSPMPECYTPIRSEINRLRHELAGA
jgi:hypothetical protein